MKEVPENVEKPIWDRSKAQRSGFGSERRRSGVSELRAEKTEVRDTELVSTIWANSSAG